MARETRADFRIRELKASSRNDGKDQTYDLHSGHYDYGARLCGRRDRMAAANYGASKAARARAEKVLDDYFALVEQAVCWTEQNPLDRRC